jgi:hypothetical protein
MKTSEERMRWHYSVIFWGKTIVAVGFLATILAILISNRDLLWLLWK